SVPSGAGMVWNLGVRLLAPSVLSHAPRSRPVLVGDAGNPADPSPRHHRRLSPCAPSNVCGILSVGDRAGPAAAELDRRSRRPRRLRHPVRVSGRARGTDDGSDVRRRVPGLCGAHLAGGAGGVLMPVRVPAAFTKTALDGGRTMGLTTA